MKNKKVLFVIAFAMLLTGCKKPVEMPAMPAQPAESQVEVVEKTVDENMEVDITDEEKLFFTEWANDGAHMGFLFTDYDTPEDADFIFIFYNGANVASEATNDILKAFYDPTKDYWGDKFFIKKEDADRVLMEAAGITSDDMNGIKFDYSEDAKGFLSAHTDAIGGAFLCTGGSKKGNTYWVDYENTTAVFINEDGHFMIQENHPDDTEWVQPLTMVNTTEIEDGKILFEEYSVDKPEEVQLSYILNSDGQRIYESQNGYSDWFFYDGKAPLFSITYGESYVDGQPEITMHGVSKSNPVGDYFVCNLFDWEGDEIFPTDVTLYGDTIAVMEEIGDDVEFLVGKENPQLIWNNNGVRTLLLKETTPEFEPFTNSQVRDYVENLTNALGKRVGESFTVVDEGTGGGSIYRRYTILGISR